MYHSIKNGAVFVADAHFNKNRNELEKFINLLENDKIKTTQLFLMGDIFDFLTGESRYFIKQNSEIIDRLNNLSKKIEIIYFEGNHDYNLKDLFKNIKVLKREEQPFFMQYENIKIALSHGDIFTPKLYDVYCKIIRNSALLKFLNRIDFNFWLSKKIEKALENKQICRNMKTFEDIAKKRVENYDANMIIEGHFHQGCEYNFENIRYINIPSLYCQKEFVVFDGGKFSQINFMI